MYMFIRMWCCPGTISAGPPGPCVMRAWSSATTTSCCRSEPASFTASHSLSARYVPEHSSLRYLGELPANVIKIDRSFVSSRDPHHTSTLESIVHLAQRLGMFVVAEGIKDATDLERLAQYGDIAGQGFHFARPMPAAEGRSLVERSAPHALFIGP
jgi:hypothetical protein